MAAEAAGGEGGGDDAEEAAWRLAAAARLASAILTSPSRCRSAPSLSAASSSRRLHLEAPLLVTCGDERRLSPPAAPHGWRRRPRRGPRSPVRRRPRHPRLPPMPFASDQTRSWRMRWRWRRRRRRRRRQWRMPRDDLAANRARREWHRRRRPAPLPRDGAHGPAWRPGLCLQPSLSGCSALSCATPAASRRPTRPRGWPALAGLCRALLSCCCCCERRRAAAAPPRPADTGQRLAQAGAAGCRFVPSSYTISFCRSA